MGGQCRLAADKRAIKDFPKFAIAIFFYPQNIISLLRLIKHIAANTPIIANKNSKPGIGVVLHCATLCYAVKYNVLHCIAKFLSFFSATAICDSAIAFAALR